MSGFLIGVSVSKCSKLIENYSTTEQGVDVLKGKLASPRFMVKSFSLNSSLSDYAHVPMAPYFRYCSRIKEGSIADFHF